MPKFQDALRGYAFETMKRDCFKCRYCGLDGTESFSNWLALSEDHLFPKGHPKRDDREFIVCAGNFCNTADNWYFRQAETRGLNFDGMTPEQVGEQRRAWVVRTRERYHELWGLHVTPQ